MIYKVIQFLSQGAFPSPEKLIELKQQGVTHLLNLSGIDLFKLYSAEQLAGFTIKQFTFRDVFSVGSSCPIEQIDKLDSKLYCQQTTEQERAEFFNAVSQLLEWLEDNTHTYVFCQQGLGRSPCVVLTALEYFYQPHIDKLIKTLQFLNRQAILTEISYAALKWFQQQMKEK